MIAFYNIYYHTAFNMLLIQSGFHIGNSDYVPSQDIPKKLSMKSSPPRQGLQLKRPPQIPQAKRPQDKQTSKLKSTSTAVRSAGANGDRRSVANARIGSRGNTVPSQAAGETSDTPGPRDSVGDVSFHNCMHQREVHEEVRSDSYWCTLYIFNMKHSLCRKCIPLPRRIMLCLPQYQRFLYCQQRLYKLLSSCSEISSAYI